MIAVRNYREDDEASVVAVIRDLQRHEGQYFDRLKPAEEVGPWYVGVLQKELAQGEAERRGDERNYARYLERVNELKAAVARKEADVAALRRELAKLGAP